MTGHTTLTTLPTLLVHLTVILAMSVVQSLDESLLSAAHTTLPALLVYITVIQAMSVVESLDASAVSAEQFSH